MVVGVQVFEFLGSCKTVDNFKAMQEFVLNTAPNGNGFNSGTTLERAGDNKIILSTSFHHMNEMSEYDGWTEHKITITPSLSARYHLKISGSNKNRIKDYISDIFHEYLSQDINEIKEYNGKIFNYRTNEWENKKEKN